MKPLFHYDRRDNSVAKHIYAVKSRALPLRIRHCSPLDALQRQTGWRLWWSQVQQSFRLMVGVRDYENYLCHMREKHPEKTPMSERDFHRWCLDARFPSEPGKLGKCPC
ncbi:hypothetical protein CIG19_03180 [Enterobacterales bacterium CwR94]|nr:hypothetical protein CIG19_03180 [Enterobacterales bacterium CwR94]